LRSTEDAAANLCEFRNERTGILASQGRGVYLRGQQDGGCQVCAAGETTLIGPSWKIVELGNPATHATGTNQVLINVF
jgi:cytochrome c551/c552